jgi:hypothetical protein
MSPTATMPTPLEADLPYSTSGSDLVDTRSPGVVAALAGKSSALVYATRARRQEQSREVDSSGRFVERLTDDDVSPLTSERQQIAPDSRSVRVFHPIGRWIGRVTSIESETFWAEVSDRDNPSDVNEVEFLRADISPSDEKHLLEGAQFYWTVGFAMSVGRQRSRSSVLRFRRPRPWSRHELDTAEFWAAAIVRKLG